MLSCVTGYLVKGVQPYQDAGPAMGDLVHLAHSMSGKREQELVLRTGAEGMPCQITVRDPKFVTQVVPYAVQHFEKLLLLPHRHAGLNMLHRLATNDDRSYVRLRELTVIGVRHLNNPALVQRLARKLGSLEKLQVGFVSHDAVENSTSSRILNGEDDDAALAALAREFPDLRRLALGGARLRIRQPNADRRGVRLEEAVKSLRQLEELSLPGALSTSSFSSGPARLMCALGSSPSGRTLKRLNLHGNNLDSAQTMLITANMPNLEELDIGGHRSSAGRKLQAGALRHVAADLTRLTALHMNDAWDPLLHPAGGSLAQLLAPARDHLVVLSVAGCMLSGVDALRVVEALPALRALDLSSSPAGIIVAPGTPGGVTWDTTSVLYGREDPDMTWLAPLSQLTRLALANTMASASQALMVATRLTRLRSLDISYNMGIDADVMAEVRRLLPAAEVM